MGDRTYARHELLDLVHHTVGVSHEERVVAAGQLHIAGVGNVLGEVTALAGPYRVVIPALQDQGGLTDERQRLPYVELAVQLEQRDRPARAGAAAHEPAPRPLPVRVSNQAGG